jgi:hypothetical protein
MVFSAFVKDSGGVFSHDDRRFGLASAFASRPGFYTHARVEVGTNRRETRTDKVNDKPSKQQAK